MKRIAVILLPALAALIITSNAMASGYGRPSVAQAEPVAAQIALKQCKAWEVYIDEGDPLLTCATDTADAVCAQMAQHPQRTYCLALFELQPPADQPGSPSAYRCTRGINLTFSKQGKIRVTAPNYKWKCKAIPGGMLNAARTNGPVAHAAIDAQTAVDLANRIQARACGRGATWFCRNAYAPAAVCGYLGTNTPGVAQWGCYGAMVESQITVFETKVCSEQSWFGPFGGRPLKHRQRCKHD